MADHITHDSIYNTVDRDDFNSMIEVPRYGDRTDAFDQIISATHDHFWDPTDPVYIDFDAEPFDLSEDTLMPRDFAIELNCAVADRLDEGQKTRLANEITRWSLSSILHGEQGALSLSASLCQILRDPGAQEYAANQVREEARHVTGFSRYITRRFGTPYPCGVTLGSLMNELVLAPEVYKKLVGMQMLIEGLAMGAFATLHVKTRDPLLRRLVQLVMTDEAFHHRFGKIWADRTVPKLTEEEHEKVEQWAADCFQKIFFNLVNAEQKQVIYGQFGLDWKWVRDAVQEAFTDNDRRRLLREGTNIFRVLIKTLLNAGIITDRTKSMYAMWVDMDELKREGTEMIGDPIAEEGIAYLRELNSGRKKIGRAFKTPAPAPV
ncbi:MAG TPA: ferritin-like domain-containing protein [Candidatus Limnocylindrales bacterium]|nr:ferritin-like domain-containing protein [Candidatus Limnocylindrales bacterium]